MRQNFVGMVVSNAMQKTIKVKVTSQKLHPIVLKVYKIYILLYSSPPGYYMLITNNFRLLKHTKTTSFMMRRKLANWVMLYVLKLADL